MKEKVAFFIRAMHGGGAQRAMVRLATGFANAGYAVDVLTLEPEGSFRAELSPLVRLRKMEAKRIGSAVPELARYLAIEKPAAMLVTEPACNIAVITAKLLARSQTRILIREGLFPTVAAKESPHKATRLAYRVAPMLYRYADVIVAIANDMAADLATFARLPTDRITTIPVNPVVTPELIAKASQTPSHIWFTESVPVILGVGRLDRQKDFATLIKAFEIVRAKQKARLLIIGEGPLRADLERLVQHSSFGRDISLPGFSANPFPEMAACAVFVLSSRYEGLPNVLIEALACGAPVVATNCPSGPRDVLEAGRYGTLVPVGDTEGMAAAISLVLIDGTDREKSRRRGDDFTLEKSAARYIDALFPAVASNR